VSEKTYRYSSALLSFMLYNICYLNNVLILFAFACSCQSDELLFIVCTVVKKIAPL